MIENISYHALINNSCEIRIMYPSGATVHIIYNDRYPLQIQEAYNKFFAEFDKSYPLIYEKSGEELSKIFQICFLTNNFPTPVYIYITWDEERERIGKRIKELREEKKMDAKKLATFVGIDPSNLSKIEQGKHSVGFDILSKIASALGYKIDFIKL